MVYQRIENEVYQHIRKHLEKDFHCTVRATGGMPEHLHMLFLLNPNFAVKDILKNVKRDSSHRINQENLTKAKFVGQIGYGAFSVSESNVDNVYRYIQNQKEHHKKKMFAEEYDTFIERHGLSNLEKTYE